MTSTNATEDKERNIKTRPNRTQPWVYQYKQFNHGSFSFIVFKRIGHRGREWTFVFGRINFWFNRAWLSRQRREWNCVHQKKLSWFNSPYSYLAGEKEEIDDPVSFFHWDSMLLTEQVPTILFRLEGPRGCLWPLLSRKKKTHQLPGVIS